MRQYNALPSSSTDARSIVASERVPWAVGSEGRPFPKWGHAVEPTESYCETKPDPNRTCPFWLWQFVVRILAGFLPVKYPVGTGAWKITRLRNTKHVCQAKSRPRWAGSVLALMSSSHPAATGMIRRRWGVCALRKIAAAEGVARPRIPSPPAPNPARSNDRSAIFACRWRGCRPSRRFPDARSRAGGPTRAREP